LVSVLGEQLAHAPGPAHEPSGRDNPPWQPHPEWGRRRRRLGLGYGAGRGSALADRARAPSEHAHDRCRRWRHVCGIRRGAAWTGNYVDGVISRIAPRTNSVTGRVQVGAAQALAAGAGSAWVSVAGEPGDGTLLAASCTEVASGGSNPDVLIASDLPLQGPEGATYRALTDAIRFVLKDNAFRAGEHVVGYQSCDDSTAQTGRYEDRKCAANRQRLCERGAARDRDWSGQRPAPGRQRLFRTVRSPTGLRRDSR
jgi:hypothetical protein